MRPSTYAPLPLANAAIFALTALSALAAGCSEDARARTFSAPAPRPPSPPATSIHQPRTLGALDTGIDPATGRRTAIACATCHGPTQTESLAAGAKASPHGPIGLHHGDLKCVTCHDAADRTRLHLADGTRIPFADTILLCAQCHGPQMRDYNHGAHGGMSGYWDTTRGARVRNQCVDCHSPHAPAYPEVRPAPPPRDRRIDSPGAH